MASVSITPMEPDDVDDAVSVFETGWTRELSPPVRERLAVSLAHLVRATPEGSHVARIDEHVVGFATADVADGLWLLSALFVRPEHQQGGLGRALLSAAFESARGTGRRLILTSGNPRATRLYASFGFTVHPAMAATGRPNLETLGAVACGREVGPDDVGELDAIDARVRGAVRSHHIALLLSQGARGLIAHDGPQAGYVLLRDGAPPVDGVPLLLVASDDALAAALLRQALALAERPVTIDPLTANRQWAYRVAVDAGLRLMPAGAVCEQGIGQPASGWITSPLFG